MSSRAVMHSWGPPSFLRNRSAQAVPTPVISGLPLRSWSKTCKSCSRSAQLASTSSQRTAGLPCCVVLCSDLLCSALHTRPLLSNTTSHSCRSLQFGRLHPRLSFQRLQIGLRSLLLKDVLKVLPLLLPFPSPVCLFLDPSAEGEVNSQG